MKKLVLAGAVGAALAMISAANAEVSVYGKAHVSIDSLSNGDESFIYVSNNSSRIGFKASEEIDGGLKASFSAEQTITMDGAGTSVFDRETYVSLGGGFGSFAVGKIDTPTKEVGRKVDFFNDQIGDSRNLIQQSTNLEAAGHSSATLCAGLKDAAAAVGATPAVVATTPTLAACKASLKAKNVGYDSRFGNMITYTTPEMGGFGAKVAFVPEDGTKKASGFDVAVDYTGGPLFVGFSYATHGKGMNASLASAGSDETESGLRLAASYAIGDFKVAGLFESLKDIGGFKDLNTTVIGVGASFKLGAGMVKGQLYKADEYKDMPKTGATLIALGYDHALSKNSSVYVAIAVTNNEDKAKYGMAGAGHGANPGVATDTAGNSESPSGVSFGMVTKF